MFVSMLQRDYNVAKNGVQRAKPKTSLHYAPFYGTNNKKNHQLKTTRSKTTISSNPVQKTGIYIAK